MKNSKKALNKNLLETKLLEMNNDWSANTKLFKNLVEDTRFSNDVLCLSIERAFDIAKIQFSWVQTFKLLFDSIDDYKVYLNSFEASNETDERLYTDADFRGFWNFCLEWASLMYKKDFLNENDIVQFSESVSTIKVAYFSH